MTRAARTPATEKLLRQFFEQTITITEENVRQLTAPLKTNKAAMKFDFKEKSKRQEQAIKDLSNLTISLLAQIKQVETKCVGFESESANSLMVAQMQLQELDQSNTKLRSNEDNLRKECSRALEKAAEAEGDLISSKKETDPLRKTIKDLESRISILVVDGANDQAAAKSLQEEKKRLLQETSELKQECRAAKESVVRELKTANSDFEMRLQAQRAEVKAELAAFSAAQIEELKREATEAEHRMHEERDAHQAAMLKQEQRSDETVSALQAELSAEREERRALAHKVRVLLLLLLLRRCPCTCVFRCCSSTACDSRYLSPPSPPSPASPASPFSPSPVNLSSCPNSKVAMNALPASSHALKRTFASSLQV